MAFQLSPGINVSEIDLTTVVPAVATSDGAIAGVFRWGPIGQRVLIDSENLLASRFGTPTNFNAETWFTAANFLAYSNRLYVSRAAKTTGATPTAESTSANTPSSANTLLVTNTEPFEIGMYVTQSTNNDLLDASLNPSIVSVNSSSITLSSAVKYTNELLKLSSITGVNAVSIASLTMNTASKSTTISAVNTSTNVATVSVLGFSVGDAYTVYQTSNTANVITTGTISAVNITPVNVNLYFARPDTAYSAVAVDAANNSAVVANLVNQIVKNENEYDSKDGNFDLDVLYVAKYPGELGNSIKVSVADTASAFSSEIPLANSTVNTAIRFEIGSNLAKIKFLGSSNTSAAGVAAKFTAGDYLLAGNTNISQQYLLVTDVTVAGNNTANVAFDGSSDSTVNLTTGFISSNNISNGSILLTEGDAVVYSNTTGNAIGGLTNGTTYYVKDANTSGFKVSTTPYGAAVALTALGAGENKFLSNTNVITISSQDPYRLRENFVAKTVSRYWSYFNVVETAPGQSDYQRFNGNTAAMDEMHVVVVDEGGMFTGTPGSVLEVYKNVSRATDAKNNDGSTNYYKDVINQNSEYIWWTADRRNATSASAVSLASSLNNSPANMTMRFGADGLNESTATLSILGAAYDQFVSTEDIDISLVLQGKPVGGTTVVGGETISNFQLANYIIDNICEVRKDCIALISPDKAKVLNNVGNEALSLKNWRGAVRSTSYAVMDSGYKYQYDRYNDIYRWIPMNGDIAGLCARTDQTNDAWWSPAGLNRGNIKNVVKLAWNPRKAERDVLYSNGVNPVVTFPGQGTVLYGDKTLLAKPSAFDRINVRRLFIVLEKAISTASKYSLFEFNDAFTRAQFKNLVTPYLRTIQGRRGITDFLVVCDETNNTAQVIDSNQFVGDIYIKPARSINFIQLNFVAVGTGVQFSEVVGRF